MSLAFLAVGPEKKLSIDLYIVVAQHLPRHCQVTVSSDEHVWIACMLSLSRPTAQRTGQLQTHASYTHTNKHAHARSNIKDTDSYAAYGVEFVCQFLVEAPVALLGLRPGLLLFWSGTACPAAAPKPAFLEPRFGEVRGHPDAGRPILGNCLAVGVWLQWLQWGALR